MNFRWSIDESYLTSNLSNGSTMWLVHIYKRNEVKRNEVWSCILDYFGRKLLTEVGDDYESR